MLATAPAIAEGRPPLILRSVSVSSSTKSVVRAGGRVPFAIALSTVAPSSCNVSEESMADAHTVVSTKINYEIPVP